MAVRLSGEQPWLTRMNAMLRETLEKHAVSNHERSFEEDFNPHFLRRLRQERCELEINMAKLQKALDNHIEAADELQPPPDENQMAKIEQNIASAQATYLKGQNRLTALCLILGQNADVPMKTLSYLLEALEGSQKTRSASSKLQQTTMTLPSNSSWKNTTIRKRL
uniref:Mediator of RNA polymerase II transcription subunit 8 n=1 Tax=Haemonchus contortus TaxID=6289 RepID=A0A7I4YDK6_HAECO